MTPKILIPIAHGSESLETVALANVLRRAEFEVTLASIERDLVVAGTRALKLAADKRFLEVLDAKFDAIALPGGEKGAEALSRHAPLIEKLEAQAESGKWSAAICAAPALVLAPHHLLDGRKATCHPAFKKLLPKYVDEAVVIDGHYLTSQGAGTAVEFALKLVELLAGSGARKQVAGQMALH